MSERALFKYLTKRRNECKTNQQRNVYKAKMQKKKKFLQIEHEFQLGFIGVWISVENLNHNIILPRIRKSAKSFYIVKYLMSK